MRCLALCFRYCLFQCFGSLDFRIQFSVKVMSMCFIDIATDENGSINEECQSNCLF